jgi:phage terminase Nu1 subunit (DNA packaging protein)
MLVTRGELAKALNLSKGRISQLEKNSVLHPTRGGKFDLEKAQAEYLAHLAKRNTPAAGDKVQEIAQIQLERQGTKLAYEKLLMEFTKLKIEIQRGIYVHLLKAQRSIAFLVMPLQANIQSIVAKFVWLVAPTRERAVEWQEIIFANIKSKLFGKINVRDLESEKTRLVAGADAVLADCNSSDAARKLATDIKAVYELIDPAIISKLGIKTLALQGDLEPVADEAHNDVDKDLIDCVNVIFRDHDKPHCLGFYSPTGGDKISLNFPDEETLQQFLLGFLGPPQKSKFRQKVEMEADLANVKFVTRIGDAVMPPDYEQKKGGNIQ